MRRNTQGFTLLEMLVASTIMGIAVVGLLSSLSTSMRNATHISAADRISQIARNKIEEFLVNPNLPYQGSLEGSIDNNISWTAQFGPFETPPQVQPGAAILQRIQLTLLWKDGPNQRQYPLEAYRIVNVPRQAQ